MIYRALAIACILACAAPLTIAEDSQKVESARAQQEKKAKGDITFDDLKFDIEKGEPFDPEMLTPEIKKLDDKKVQLRGYILPVSVFQQTGIQQFVLVRDNQECCFGPGAALYDCVMVYMVPPNTADFSTRPVTVKGKFNIKEFKYPDGTHYAIYQMKATEVK